MRNESPSAVTQSTRPPFRAPAVHRTPDPEPPTAALDARPTAAHGYDQPALVVDDFAWDVDDPEDYSAPV